MATTGTVFPQNPYLPKSGGGAGGGGGGGVGGLIAGKGSAGYGGAAAGGGAGSDISGMLVGELLNGLAGGWDTPGTPGSPGGMVSNQGLRDSLNASYGQAEADRSNVYQQVLDQIIGRAPGITAGYDQASATMQDNARARALADREAGSARDQQVMNAAQAMGLPVMPSVNPLANQVTEQNIGNYQSIADAWQGFNSAKNQTALERNTATGDAFTYQGLQQQQALQAMLMQALAGAGDYWVGGSGGSAGKSLGPKDQMSGYMNLLNWTDKDANTDIRAAKLPSAGYVKRY